MALGFLQSELDDRKQTGLYRQRNEVSSTVGTMIEVEGRHFINFSSNDYLGQRQSPNVMQAWVEGIALYGVGSGASPLVTGYTTAHKELESYLAEALNREAVILFNCGFSANQAVCQALLNKSRWAVADKLMHASFIEGATNSDAALKRFKHNDLNHLLHILAQAPQDSLIATEGVFSMDGDNADIAGILPLIDPQRHSLMLDDAHGFGVLGETGMGSAEQWTLSQQQVPILMGTFGKAIGTAGAFIAGSQALIEYLVNFAKHYIYSTAMPPAQAVATLHSLKQIRGGEQRDALNENIVLFKSLASEAGIALMNSNSAIQPVIVGDARKSLSMSEKLKSLGIWVNAIRSPTVPKGADRLRVTLSAAHSSQDIGALVDALQIASEACLEGEADV